MANEERNGQQAQRGGGFNWQGLLSAAFIGFFVMNIFSSVQDQISKAKLLEVDGATIATSTGKADGDSTLAKQRRLLPLARPGDPFSIRVTVDEDLFAPVEFANLRFDHKWLAEQHLNRTLSMDLTACAARNCSADVHVSWELQGKTFSASSPLIRFHGKRTVEKHRLIGGSEKATSADGIEGVVEGAPQQKQTRGEVVVYCAYVQPELTLSPVVDFTAPLLPQFETFTPVDEETMQYGPAVYINNFWVIRDHLREVNATTTAAGPFTLNMKVDPVPIWKIAMYTQFDQSMQSQQAMGFMTDDTADETKRIFLETNPYFLALTGLVTMLHMLFEYLAFANDIRFWHGRKDFKGLSLRSVAMNCYCQTIIFLYLVDSSEASWTILLPSAFGVLAEYWKLTQCVVITKATQDDGAVAPAATEEQEAKETKASLGTALSAFGYELRFSDSYDQRTRTHDDTAIRWLVYIMIPILLGYSVYSAVLNEHKSWYSYLINTQVQFIYFFGFAMMTPQIFINYKLKSVGQLPWRTFVYKSLNTVIDDLFAFIIKMPWLHRLACFRDDVVFVILLYQRWIYPVDMTRMADDDAPGEAGEEQKEDDKADREAGAESQVAQKKNQ